MFDTADVYSAALAEEILGQAIKGRRNTRAHFHQGNLPLRAKAPTMSARPAIISPRPSTRLRRLGTDYIDLYPLHGFDALTPSRKALHTLDDLVRAGKIRYIGCSNFSGWHLMKSLAISEKYGSRATWRIRPITRSSAATTNGNSCRWRSTRK